MSDALEALTRILHNEHMPPLDTDEDRVIARALANAHAHHAALLAAIKKARRHLKPDEIAQVTLAAESAWTLAGGRGSLGLGQAKENG